MKDAFLPMYLYIACLSRLAFAAEVNDTPLSGVVPGVLVVHALLASIATAVLMPIGLLWARYARTFVQQWFRVHWILEFWIALPVGIIGWGLGFFLDKASSDVKDVSTVHKNAGAALGFIVAIQWALGFLIHFWRPAGSRRPAQNYIHAILGLLTIAFAFFVVYSGFAYQLPASTGVSAPGGLGAALGVWVAVVFIAYAAGLGFLPRQREQEAARHPGVEGIQAQSYIMMPRD